LATDLYFLPQFAANITTGGKDGRGITGAIGPADPA
jgi:hypothetical protein